jgi:eukaryotic-like serine/threonine-protein kinase
MSRTFDREEALFTDALALPAADRAAFLDAECAGEPALRERVVELLAAHDEEVSTQRVTGVEPFGLLTEERPGDRFGPYKLLMKIGEGGCGVVFMAEQEKPVRRRVALKVIKAGMDTREVIARFEAERQALAMMDHPGICKVLDAGATRSGRPFFVMELVRGVPITRYCDENQLTTRARLELFLQVCHAVQHAHQKGIIHRDLKPSNILVTLHGDLPAPKIIDFGIAKATQGRLTDSTLVTAFEQFLGTPAYMAPEQAEMSGLDIDTRTDVYSLGVLLYELLTGRPPFDPKALMVASHDELRRIIREVEPPKPSTHLSTLAENDRSSVALRRGTDPLKLRGLIAGDLDWIVMKALEKHRTRRYDTPSAFADDITRHLDHEPVVASPPGNLYKLSKFIRRHRVGVGAVTSIVLVLLAGTIVSSFLALRATRAEHVAQRERHKAVEGRKRADSLLTFMLGDLRTEVQKVGNLDLLSLVGTQATTYFATLDPQDLSDEALTQQVKALRQIGEVQISKAQYTEALTTLEAALARAATAVARHPENGDTLYEYALVQYSLGYLFYNRGDRNLSSQWLNRHRETVAALVKKDPTRSDWQSEFAYSFQNIAVLELRSGNVENAREGFLAALRTAEVLVQANPQSSVFQSQVADIVSWLGTTADSNSDFSEALQRYSERAARFETLSLKEPGNREWHYSLAASLIYQSDILAITDRRSEAREKLSRAIAILEDLVSRDKTNRSRQFVLLRARLREVMLAEAAGDLPSAHSLLNRIQPELAALVAAEPTSKVFLAGSALTWRLEAYLRLAAGRPDAKDAAAKAIQFADSLLGEGRSDNKNIAENAQAYITAGLAAESTGDDRSSRQYWNKALDIAAPRAANSRDWRLLDPRARALFHLGRRDEANAIIQRLTAWGYRPLQPWPEVRGRVSISPINPNH